MRKRPTLEPFAARNGASKIARSGVYGVIDRLTAQGFDMQFGTNVLGTGRV
jgi:hypothetical protein